MPPTLATTLTLALALALTPTPAPALTLTLALALTPTLEQVLTRLASMGVHVDEELPGRPVNSVCAPEQVRPRLRQADR